MIRTIYTLSIVALLGSTAWTATGIEDRSGGGSGIGLVLLAALQR